MRSAAPIARAGIPQGTGDFVVGMAPDGGVQLMMIVVVISVEGMASGVEGIVSGGVVVISGSRETGAGPGEGVHPEIFL
jgi:hypothetical protein